MALEDLQRLAVSPISLSVLAISIVTGIYIKTRPATRTSDGPSLPPGPVPDFLIGNIRQFPKDHMSDTFCTWAQTYGSVVHARIPGMRLILLNSYEVAQELLSKRPNATAERNTGLMFMKIMGLSWFLTSQPPGPRHSEVRKMLRRGIGPQRVAHHDPMIEKAAMALVLKLQASKGDPVPVIMSEVGRLVTTVTYGEEIWKIMGDDLAAWNIEEMGYVNEALANFWPVEVLPIMRFIPGWVPGAYFKKMGNRATWLSHQIRRKPFAKAQELYQSGDLGHSITADLIEEFGAVENVQDALAAIYLGKCSQGLLNSTLIFTVSAGADTTSTGIIAFLHALYLFPEVARKVYEEITTVTEGMRLPELKDRPRLLYTDAVWKESFRWNTWFPVGVPHVNSYDEIVNGFLIPKKSLIMPNNEFILMDPHVWGDPQTFRPERFLEPGADSLPNPLTVIFGYGMRICPGLYLADRIGFQHSASVATLFSILPMEGSRVTDPSMVEYSDAAMRLPLGFECRFVPRGEKETHLLSMMSL